MNISFQASLLFVKDISASRAFYENVLGQKIEYGFGQDIMFQGGFALHDANHMSQLLFNRPNPHVDNKIRQREFRIVF